MSVARARSEISASEFAEWQGYALLEPFGPEQEALRAALGPATAAQIAWGKRRRVSVLDYVAQRPFKSRRPNTSAAAFDACAKGVKDV